MSGAGKHAVTLPAKKPVHSSALRGRFPVLVKPPKQSIVPANATRRSILRRNVGRTDCARPFRGTKLGNTYRLRFASIPSYV